MQSLAGGPPHHPVRRSQGNLRKARGWMSRWGLLRRLEAGTPTLWTVITKASAVARVHAESVQLTFQRVVGVVGSCRGCRCITIGGKMWMEGASTEGTHALGSIYYQALPPCAPWKTQGRCQVSTSRER